MGAHLGGTEVVDNHYLMLGSKVSFTENYGCSNTRNLFLTLVPKDAKTADKTTPQMLTNYTGKSNISIVQTHFMKIDDNKFVIMYVEAADSTNKLYYVVVNGKGNVLGDRTLLENIPAPGGMNPVVVGNKIV